MKNPTLKRTAGRGAWTFVAGFCFVLAGLAALQGVSLSPVTSVMHQTYQMGWWILSVLWIVGGLVSVKR